MIDKTTKKWFVATLICNIYTQYFSQHKFPLCFLSDTVCAFCLLNIKCANKFQSMSRSLLWVDNFAVGGGYYCLGYTL